MSRLIERTGCAVRASALIVAILAATMLGGPAEAENRALIIGVGEYPYLGKPGQLREPVNDAKKFHRFVLEQNWFSQDQITTLYDRAATKAEIFRHIEEKLIRETQPGDKVLLYFAGHGARSQDLDGDEDDSFDETLLPSDVPADGRASRQIIDDELGALLDRIGDREVMVVVDACHSGTVTRGVEVAEENQGESVLPRGLPPFVIGTRGVARADIELETKTLEEGPIAGNGAVRSVWSAASPAQQSWEDSSGGVFTRVLMEAIQTGAADTNRNGKLTAAELLDHVRLKTEAWCAQLKDCRNNGFTPLFEGPGDRIVATYDPPAGDGATTGEQAPFESFATGTVETAPETETAVNPGANVATKSPAAAPPAESPIECLRSTSGGPALAASDLFGSANEARLTIRFEPSAQARIGERRRVTARADRSGLLVVLDINARCQIYQLSPSQLSQPDVGSLAAGEAISIPEGFGPSGLPLTFEATEPTGRGQLVAILIEDQDSDLERLFGANLMLEPLDDAATYLRRLSASLRRMQVENKANRQTRWSVAYENYEIY